MKIYLKIPKIVKILYDRNYPKLANKVCANYFRTVRHSTPTRTFNIEVFVDPSPKELRELNQLSKEGIRVFKTKDHLYAWSGEALHEWVINAIPELRKIEENNEDYEDHRFIGTLKRNGKLELEDAYY